MESEFFVVVAILLICCYLLFRAIDKEDLPIASPDIVRDVNYLTKCRKLFVAGDSNCPHFNAAVQTLFLNLNIPENDAIILKLNEMPYGGHIHQALIQLSNQRYKPYVYLGGEFVGRNVELQKLRASGELQRMIRDLYLMDNRPGPIPLSPVDLPKPRNPYMAH
ncbi:hypothetical protein TBLA_0A07365 [Henningerozyma blattae CBS 6284]|uniref:Uncharacterized protein n=1 Tax=Henningerozyma blattae (strain ATCC 34711 / CBS 6284 / DSM 70876 / NBRC 10599 / NRRL Y-10934 / UCD 77-7) TaxID=1071380 RepID=I2GWM4_HENB6|nr:hypothetical protein TBLA_0A07365 [Tetrapisispora blattae CBS 6284]CCH58526.1 hypothetical protein TBLA_0A07365 [Tetrapisispora blattae CBS 6284]